MSEYALHISTFSAFTIHRFTGIFHCLESWQWSGITEIDRTVSWARTTFFSCPYSITFMTVYFQLSAQFVFRSFSVSRTLPSCSCMVLARFLTILILSRSCTHKNSASRASAGSQLCALPSFYSLRWEHRCSGDGELQGFAGTPCLCIQARDLAKWQIKLWLLSVYSALKCLKLTCMIDTVSIQADALMPFLCSGS